MSVATPADPPPRPSPLDGLIRAIGWASWRSVTKIVVILSIFIAALSAVLLWRTALEANPSTAINVMIGEQQPFSRGLGAWAVALAVTGWLVIPVLIGTAVTLVIERVIRRALAMEQGRLEELRTKVEELAAAQQARRSATPPVEHQ